MMHLSKNFVTKNVAKKAKTLKLVFSNFKNTFIINFKFSVTDK